MKHERLSLVLRCWSCLLILCTMALLGAADAKVSILHLMNPAHGDPFNAVLIELAGQFSAGHPDVSVQLELAAGDYNGKVATMVAAGVAPDVIHIVNNQAAQFVSSGMLLNLRPYAERDGLDLARLFPRPVLEALEWETVLFGMPIFAQAIAVNYNAELFGRSGILTPTDQYARGSWTWQSYLESAKKLTVDKDGDGVPEQYGTAMNTGLERWPIWVWQAGGAVFNSRVNPTASTFLSAPVRQALEYYTSWKTVHGVTGGNFEQGTQALNPFQGPWSAGNLKDVGIDWNVAPMAKGPDSNVTGLFINNVQVPSQTKHPQAAWEWVRFLTLERDTVVRFIQASGRTPALIRAFPAYLESVPKPSGRAVWIETLNDSRPIAITPKYAQINKVTQQELNRVNNGQQSVEQMLTILQQQVDAILAE